MASREETTLPATRRPKSRKSLAHVPSSTVDKENATVDAGHKTTPLERPTKKLRSKSIGPGGLDALADTSGNRRKSLNAVPHPPPRSILKPSIPPLREIPAHVSSRKGSPTKATPPTSKDSQNELLIDFDVGSTVIGAEILPNPFEVQPSAAVGETRVTLRTEEEQQAAAKEREEKERLALEQEGNTRREARRKSLANRRVSFAPEATLHTWDVVVEYQDSTTSSNSTTRRASAGGTLGPQAPGPPSSDPSEPPSTPPEQVKEETVKGSPGHQRDLHQKKRRRSSAVPPMNFNNPDDEDFSSSPDSASSVEDAEEAVEADESNSDSDNDGTVTMDIDGTDMSMASVKSASSAGSSARLEESLRLAADQAGTQGIDFDEHGDEVMEEEDEVVGTFKPWAQRPGTNLSALQDQENVNPFSPAFKAVVAASEDARSDEGDMTMEMTQAGGQILASKERDDEDMSMDVTRAVGGIISNASDRKQSRKKSMPANRRQSTRRRSSGARSSLGDETMELTTAIGGIHAAEDDTGENNDEDMTMEFTSVIGGVLPPPNAQKSRRRSSIAPAGKPQTRKSRESLEPAAEDQTMDMTMAMGGIMAPITEMTGEQDATMEMDMTKALGVILPRQLSTGNRGQAKKLMELETDAGSSPFQVDVPANSPPKPQNPMTVASETGSPSLAAFRGKGLRRSTGAKPSRLSNSTPVKKPTTPSKQMTPEPRRPTTPSKSSPLKDVSMRSASPKQLFKPESTSNTPRSSAKKVATPNQLFQKDSAGKATPSFVLTHQRRVSSGIGIDRVGLGSPRVAELLDRRGSLGDTAKSFVPSQPQNLARGVRFDDPRSMEDEIDKEREHDEDRENGRKIMEREADQGEEEKDVTLNLKEMINSLTPKKKPLRGRKSLHVGAAKGLLGKRPAELDEDDEDEENDGVKRLKNHQGSPVKNVRLQGPPTKAETTGRMTRAARRSLEDVTNIITPTIGSSPNKDKATTPRGQGRFKNAEDSPVKVASIAEPELVPQMVEESLEDDRIQLQDFLNMTSIRFMELTTTKRRHTVAPKDDGLSRNRNSDEGKVSLEDCVAAGAATIPMLELFQHACHELKKYISEGRKTVREIETDTFEENPPLFREYISATPDFKLIMDNQLKNVKTHARLLSKAEWYKWRTTLLETLKDGLLRTVEGMDDDEQSLARQHELLNSIYPDLVRQAEALEVEEAELKYAAEELANCDPSDLSDARQKLISVDADIQAKKQLVTDLQKQLEGKETEIEAGTQRKQEVLGDIKEAERIREECRGWNSSEISALRAKVEALESTYGWTITGVSGTVTSMTYKKQIELVFDAASFLSSQSPTKSRRRSSSKHQPNTSLDLWYIATHHPSFPSPLTSEKDFHLQSIRDHIRSLPQSTIAIKYLLASVSESWEKVLRVSENIRLLRLVCPTEVEKTSDTSLLVRSSLLIPQLGSKVELRFGINAGNGNGNGGKGVEIGMEYSAQVVYGERFNEAKMGEFLRSRCGDVVELERNMNGDGEGKKGWGEAAVELGERLLARGRK